MFYINEFQNIQFVLIGMAALSITENFLYIGRIFIFFAMPAKGGSHFSKKFIAKAIDSHFRKKIL